MSTQRPANLGGGRPNPRKNPALHTLLGQSPLLMLFFWVARRVGVLLDLP